MSGTVAEKIIKTHLVEGLIKPGEDIAITIDQTLTQDATGTMTYLQFEAIGIPRVRTELSVSYIDHNLLQTDHKNADDHRYLQSVAAKYGVLLSKPGNGVSHQVHLERFSIPGKTLLGSDSHTPTNGAQAMLAIGAGGLDVAMAMAGQPFHLKMPSIVGIKLTGSLKPWVSAKDVILEVLRRLTVKGGVGRIIEYFGPGLKSLDIPSRASITNMGAELGATTSIFPSDDVTKDFLKNQGRIAAWTPLVADEDAAYDEVIEIDLGEIEPMIALPSSPDNVRKVKDVAGEKVSQALIGSCSNSSLKDLMITAAIVKDSHIHNDVSLEINPGSRQVLENLVALNWALTLLRAGARIHQPGCMGCIGMGQAPSTDSISLRSFPRNFSGRSGTKGDKVFLCSPETAAASALRGVITDPRDLGEYPEIELPGHIIIDDGEIIHPPEDGGNIKVIRGPNIKALPEMNEIPPELTGTILIKLGDNVSTDDIMPAGTKILSLRSNIPAISEFVFSRLQPGFAKMALEMQGGFIVAGENYGQGSSREHAAIAPKYLGIKAVLAKSFARIHKSNLVNFGILPLEFKEKSDYNKLDSGSRMKLLDVRNALAKGSGEATVETDDERFQVLINLSDRERAVLLEGGLMNFIKKELDG